MSWPEQKTGNEEAMAYEEASQGECEPGACRESSLITTDSFEEFNRELNQIEESPTREDDKQMCHTLSSSANENVQQSSAWANRDKHIFILSTAGKPIYSLYGDEDKLASLFGVMQALVSVVQAQQDNIRAIQANGLTIVFLVKSPLILVAVSRLNVSIPQMQLQLIDVYNQIISTLTLEHINKIYEKRANFDFRRLLGGSERFIEHLLLNNGIDYSGPPSNDPFIFLTHSVRILPMAPSTRDSITGVIQSCCNKVNNLVFVLLVAKNKLITLVRNKQCFIHPADLRIILNMIECSKSFQTGESWYPICLPKFNPNGYLHAYVSYLAEESDICLLIFSVEKDMFFELSEIKKRITEKLTKNNSLQSINEAVAQKEICLKTIGLPDIRHFLYKSKYNTQLSCSNITAPYNTPEQFQRLLQMYYGVHHRVHDQNRPLKLILEVHEYEVVLAWVTVGYELYASFEPFISKINIIGLVNKLLRWIKREENTLFMMSSPVL